MQSSIQESINMVMTPLIWFQQRPCLVFEFDGQKYCSVLLDPSPGVILTTGCKREFESLIMTNNFHNTTEYTKTGSIRPRKLS